MLPYLTIACILFAFLALYVLKRFLWRSSLPLPPGPKGLPVVGNLFDIPSEKEWLTFAQWGEQWGGICSVTVLGQSFIILNSAEIAVEMLEKKNSIYSDRPVLHMAGELVGWKNLLGLLPYGERFRRFRRMFLQVIGKPSTIKQFLPLEEFATHRFLRRVLANPADLAAHVRWAAGAIILRISYGYDVQETNDSLVELVEKVTDDLALYSSPGAFMVDLVPALRYIPSWFPGAGFQKLAKSWASTLLEMVNQPYDLVKQQMAAGTAPVSFTSNLLENKHLTPDEEFIIKWSAASLYSGGADTTVSAIYSFFLAMTLHPEVLKKAQAEIDAIIGNDRLPIFADRENLPYVDALVTEVFRWHSVAPLGLPHRVMQDDTHAGYFIPKGSRVITNIWKFTHDPRIYANPHLFNPDRFISSEGKKSEPDPRNFCFGFGRRTCPGLHLADTSVFITCAMSLAVFDISKCIKNGVIIEPVHENTTGVVSHPKPFRCSIKPRSQRAASLIQDEQLK